MRKVKRFKEVLNKLLSTKVSVGTLPDAIKRGAKGESITLLEAVLLAQINKALCGDTSSATFLRDTSGNKLKDASPDITVNKRFEDL